MAKDLKVNRSEFFPAYFAALAAYRLIMMETLRSLISSYGAEELKAHFNANSITNLSDAYDPRFLTRTEAARFVREHPTKEGRRTIAAMSKRLQNDTRLNNLRKLLYRAGDKVIADDLAYFIEHRVRLAREFTVSKPFEHAFDVPTQNIAAIRA